MKTWRSVTVIGVAIAAAWFSGGCGDSDSPGAFPTYPVKGSVLLDDGKPLSSGRVILVSRERAMEFEGKVDRDGSFSVASNLGDGAPEGTYRVRVEPDGASLPRAKSKSLARKSPFPFPARYSNEDTSELTARIHPGENRLEPFRLTAAVRKADPGSSARSGN